MFCAFNVINEYFLVVDILSEVMIFYVDVFRSCVFGVRASSAAPSLSSKTVHVTVGVVIPMGNCLALSSSSNSMSGISFLSAVDIPMYSLSVVLNAISVCNCDAHVMGIPR